MSTFSVLKFQSPAGATEALTILERMQQQELIKIKDAAIVSWPEGRDAPKTRQAVSTTAVGALGGSFWGFLFGILFFMPLLGMAVGAISGAIGGALTDIGISDDFIRRTRDSVQPGTSALFVLSEDAVEDRVVDGLKGLNVELVTTNLPHEKEEQLRAVFTDA